MKRDNVNKTNVSDINFEDDKNYNPRFEFDLGEEIRHELLKNGNEYEEFCVNVYNFVLMAALQMANRFENFKNEIFKSTKCLNPKDAMSEEFRKKNPKIFRKLIINCYPHLTKGMRVILKITLYIL